ncbi:ATP-binding protein [Crocinitomix catalasitica]|uniref:ATP-binding protein n=1 Tax=Crocinitomix catalasitica TaxID=184607 RepID=UPI00056C746A|nr:ferredoxin family protein [Crocinitomix catalasitica]|tara:strand:+ start:448 stop:735 length:288 start_codon:yes stop_codon:yes gene_type:complete
MDEKNIKCDETSGKLKPVINPNSCGGKEDCIPVCPYDVLEMRTITDEDKKDLNLKGKIKTFFNNQKAYLKNEDQCHACGLCVQVCPEKAIKLVRR